MKTVPGSVLLSMLLLLVVSGTGLAQWNGEIEGWGYNYHGQCDVPPPNNGFVAVAAGFYHSLGLKEDGSIVAWGANGDGQCNVPSPNSDFVAVAAGNHHSLGLKENGSIVAWGLNDYGQCGSSWQALHGGCGRIVSQPRSEGKRLHCGVGSRTTGKWPITASAMFLNRTRVSWRLRGGLSQPRVEGRRLHRGVG